VDTELSLTRIAKSVDSTYQYHTNNYHSLSKHPSYLFI
jgi:hypothetical protein